MALMEYLFKNGLSNHYLSVKLTVMEAIACLIKFRNCHDDNLNGIGSGIGDNYNTIEKWYIILDRKLKKTEYLFWLENDINEWSTASLFSCYMFLLFNRPYVKDSELFSTKCSQSIHRIAIQHTRRCMIHNPMEQQVGYHNNINDLKTSDVLLGVVATIARFLAQKKYRFTVWYKFLNVILSFPHGIYQILVVVVKDE